MEFNNFDLQFKYGYSREFGNKTYRTNIFLTVCDWLRFIKSTMNIESLHQFIIHNLVYVMIYCRKRWKVFEMAKSKWSHSYLPDKKNRWSFILITFRTLLSQIFVVNIDILGLQQRPSFLVSLFLGHLLFLVEGKPWNIRTKGQLLFLVYRFLYSFILSQKGLDT